MSDEHPVHFPANPDKFEFDAEVAQIFPDMAERSIPFYREMHETHARIVFDYIEKYHKYHRLRFVDIGASHGDFMFGVIQELEKRKIEYDVWLVDTSVSMYEKMAERFKDYPMVRVINGGYDHPEIAALMNKADFVVCHYVAQFLAPMIQDEFTRAVCKLLRTGGLILWGEKENFLREGIESERMQTVAKTLDSVYIDFRISKGYSEEEIAAKTEALKGSMWPTPYAYTAYCLNSNGVTEIVPTFRYAAFHCFVGVKEEPVVRKTVQTYP